MKYGLCMFLYITGKGRYVECIICPLFFLPCSNICVQSWCSQCYIESYIFCMHKESTKISRSSFYLSWEGMPSYLCVLIAIPSPQLFTLLWLFRNFFPASSIMVNYITYSVSVEVTFLLLYCLLHEQIASNHLAFWPKTLEQSNSTVSIVVRFF